MATYEEVRQRHLAYLASILPEQIQRLRWPAERIAQERQDRLRAFLRIAIQRSPWHRERLRGVDPDTFTEADLPRLPAMTKDDLMANWDGIVTDDRLTLERADRHLASLTSDAYLFDKVHVVASGGSTGRRGVFAFGWEPWALAFVGYPRALLYDRAVSPELAGPPNTVAMVAAAHASHMTSSMGQTFANPELPIKRFPVTLPIDEIVAGLNDFQPVTLMGYPSGLALLAVEAREGRLRIAPKRIVSTSEPLLPEVRRSLEENLSAPVANCWGTSEAGPMGVGCWRSPGMHLCDDLCIVEPVDEAGQRVPAGTCSDKIYLTAFSNPTLPLIRMEITDQMTFLDEKCPCGSAHQLVTDVQGRLDDSFVYAGGVVVHPHVFRSLLVKQSDIVEYQVRQTTTGASVQVIGSPRDPAALGRAIEAELARIGLTNPCTEVRIVDGFDRQATGKVRRFVPLERPPEARIDIGDHATAVHASR